MKQGNREIHESKSMNRHLILFHEPEYIYIYIYYIIYDPWRSAHGIDRMIGIHPTALQ